MSGAVALIEHGGGEPLSEVSRARNWGGRTELNAKLIFEALASGQFMTDICEQYGFPPYAIVAWRDADTRIREYWNEARAIGAETIDREIHAIADGERDAGGNFTEPPERSKLRVYVREQRAKRLDPKGYADRKQIDVRSVNVNVDVSADPLEASRAYAALMGGSGE